MTNRIIYYYQTFVGLKNILNSNNKVTHIHLSSIHFGTDENNAPYIHLNDLSPYDAKFDSVWEDLKAAKELGIKIILMVGGAGGAFQELFSNFNTNYSLLKELVLNKKDLIDGIDLDIEEEVNITDVEYLIKQLKNDFSKEFIISMAPIQYSIENDVDGMGGFVYKKLYLKVGSMIDYFNVQCYDDYSIDAYSKMIKNGYPEDKIVMGSISSQDLNSNLEVIKNITQKYNKIGGVFNWEYYDSPPDPTNHGEWSQLMYNVLNPSH
jgi:chitinase